MKESSLNRELKELFKRTASGIKPGLETISALLTCLNDPQDSFVTVHIAGTNGKGSVAAMLESILRTAGFRTGLYTSPHLVDFRERIKIDGKPVEDDLLQKVLAEVEEGDRRQASAGGREATFFEMATAMGFLCFKESGVHVAVIETGMGGRWDATNTVQPIVSVITPVSVEHEKYLGSDIAGIASEKAGIIKPRGRVVSATQEEAVREVIAAEAEKQQAVLKLADDHVTVNRLDVSLTGQKLKMESQNQSYPPVLLPLLGEYQIDNCATALTAAEMLFEAFETPLPPDIVKMGLENVDWIGRGQIINTDPVVILDGAHNPAAARNLANLLKEIAGGRKLGMIVGMLDDKNMRAFMNPFAGWLDSCWIVEIKNPRAMKAEKMRDAVRPITRHHKICSLPDAYNDALKWAQTEDGVVCISGSIYLLGEFMQL